jgi:serpin B
MKRRMFLAVLAAMPMMAWATEPRGDYMQQVVRGNTVFAGDLFAQMRSKAGNLFCSPYSISAALGMTAAGARGPTAEEMTKVLHLPAGNATHVGFAELGHSLQAKKDSGYELSIANALWGQQGFPFERQYLELVSKNYGGGLKPVDFTNRNAAAGTINKWVEDQTKNRIKNLIDPSMLDATTKLVLTNAIYFKGQWKDKFRKEATSDQPFFTSASESIPVPMMRQGGKYRYYQDDAVQLVELPYVSERLAMTLILPREKQALARQVESQLTEENLNRWLSAASMKKGDVALPRFEFESKFELTPTLQAMGMKRAFTDAADFSGMTTAEPLKIAFVVHKAFVKVDEEGSEAAAATGVGMKLAAAPVEERFNFRADQPFVFMIRDTKTGSVLFMGRMANPKG